LFLFSGRDDPRIGLVGRGVRHSVLEESAYKAGNFDARVCPREFMFLFHPVQVYLNPGMLFEI
jgi:hypothetical protein